jgi:hypothetical protein
MGLREDLETLLGQFPYSKETANLHFLLSGVLARYPKPSGETVRVRGCVALYRNGNGRISWCLRGDNDDSDSVMKSDVTDMFATGTELAFRFITADVPLPEAPAEVEAECEATP